MKNKARKDFFALLLLIIACCVTGCSNTYWHKAEGTQADIYRDSSYCQALSSSATPLDNSYQGPTTTTHYGTVSDFSGNTANYIGTSTNYGNSAGQGLHNLGQLLGRQSIFDDCMRGRGYEERTKTGSSFIEKLFSTEHKLLTRKTDLYTEPYYTSTVIAELVKGQKVFIQDDQTYRQWTMIKDGNGNVGFISKIALKEY